jgi:hypothetical protein
MGGILRKIEEPARRPVAGFRPTNGAEAKTWIQLTNHVVLGRRDIIGDNPPRSKPASGLDGNVHGFKLKPTTEHAATHDPIVYLKLTFLAGGGAKNHCANKAIVTNPIQQAELQCQRVGQTGKMGYVFGGIPPSRRVELIGLIKQLDYAGVVDGCEWTEYNRHFESTQKLIHTLRRLEESIAFSVCGVELGALLVLGRKGHRFEIARLG